MIAEIYLKDFQNYILAAYHYTNILDNYSNSFKTSKKSLFSLAYVYANYLDYYSDANELYNKFIVLYPVIPVLINSFNYVFIANNIHVDDYVEKSEFKILLIFLR